MRVTKHAMQGDTEADTALATAKVALEAAEPAVAEAESAQQACISGNPDLDKLAR